jgi:hypothetical protein
VVGWGGRGGGGGGGGVGGGPADVELGSIRLEFGSVCVRIIDARFVYSSYHWSSDRFVQHLSSASR